MTRALTSVVYSALTKLTLALLKPLPLDVRQVPRRGPLVIVASHVGWTDHLVMGTLAYLCRGQQLAFLSHARFHRSALMRALWHRPMRSFPVGHGHTERSLAACATILRQGGTVCIYPTGRLLAPTTSGSFRPGAFRLAKETGTAVLCAGIAYVSREPATDRPVPDGRPAGVPNVALSLLGRDVVASRSAHELQLLAESTVIELEQRAMTVTCDELQQANEQLHALADELHDLAGLALRVGAAHDADVRRRLAASTVRWAARGRRSP